MAINSKIPLVDQRSFGSPPEQYSQQWFLSFTSQLMRRLSLLSGPYEAQQSFLMQSPDNRVWRITIDNSGVIQRTLVDVSVDTTRKERPPI